MNLHVKTMCLAGFAWLISMLPAQSFADASQHPAYGQEPLQLRDYPPKDDVPNLDDLTFGGPNGFPPIDSLCDIERYMLAGTKASSLPGGRGLRPWVDELSFAIWDYFIVHGQIPIRLSSEVLIAHLPVDSVSQDYFEGQLRNPFTGGWPLLKSRDPRPGDVYVRELTTEEGEFMAQHCPAFRNWWRDRPVIERDYEELERYLGRVITRKRPSPERLPALYIRVYGENGVIYSKLQIRWGFHESPGLRIRGFYFKGLKE